MAASTRRCFVLLHSPLLGPSSWRWVAAALRQRNELVVVPSFAGIGSASEPVWQWCVDIAARELSALPEGCPVVLASHSASGLLVAPVGIASEAAGHAVIASVFADAQIPGEPPDDDDWFLEHVRSIACNGQLPPWSQWWGDGAMEAFVPDDERRALIVGELESVPLAYLEESPPPSVGPIGRGTYVRFSDMYVATADLARTRGWTVDELPGEHLHMVVDPDAVAARLLAAAEEAVH